jgi:4-hydroxybenzoate polyprenyltransferase
LLDFKQNKYSKPEENKSTLVRRFFIYQKERFPLAGHGLLVAAFSFSAISYSRICRGAEGFVPWSTYFIGIFTTVTLFLLVRIFDEFKDAEDDDNYRGHLPVPRGLVSLRELMVLGIILGVLQVCVNAWAFPKMLWIYLVVIGYLSLMGKEFFVAEWLKKNQFWYVVSHMFIIPLVDVYASGLDWLLEGVSAPKGLLFFFAVSFMNGIVLEIGRKIRTPKDEAHGVLTYSSLLGPLKAARLWILILLITLSLSIAASWFAGYGMAATVVLVSVFVLCAAPALSFLRTQSAKSAKWIEWASALWTFAMYMILGGMPMLQRLLNL